MKEERVFEVCKGYEKKDIHIPERKTLYAAGYDIESAEDVVIKPFVNGMKPVLIKTGLKSKFPNDECLLLVNRSSNPVKRGLVLANSIGVIDADYYNNESNDGELLYAYYNFGDSDYHVKKGDIIGQAIFMKYLTTTNEVKNNNKRVGGIGSTDKK